MDVRQDFIKACKSAKRHATQKEIAEYARDGDGTPLSRGRISQFLSEA